ncbi:MAG: ABC transporter permease [Pseudomonadales bacterium]
MMDWDRWQEIYYTLSQHKLRTVLTSLGVFWGIFMLVVLLGAARGLENGVIGGFGGQTNTVIIWSGSRTQLPYKGMPLGRRITIRDGDLESIRQLSELGMSSSNNEMGGWQVNQYVVSRNGVGSFSTIGIEPDSLKLSGHIMLQGRFINEYDFSERRKVVVIGDAVKEILFEPGEDVIGQKLEIGSVNFVVIGIFTSNSNNPSETEQIFMANSTLRTTFNQLGWIGHIKIAPVGGVHAAELEEKARAIIMENHKVHPEDSGTLGSYNMQNEYDKVLGLFLGMKLFSWVVAIGTIVAGAIGVGNIMLIVVKERTREIGVHKALGATPWNVVSTILLETLVLTSIAGYSGLVCGVFLLEGLSTLMEASTDTGMFGKPEIDFLTAGAALLTMIMAGVGAAILPAMKAAGVDPIVALQDE